MREIENNLDRIAARFDASQDFTVGIEEEFQLLDQDNLQLTGRFEELEAATRETLGSFVRGELIASEIEICTDQCANMSEAEDDLLGKRNHLFEAASELDITLGASGTHPFADWKEQRILDTPHYQQVEEKLRYCAWRNTTFGMHTHVGVQGHERIISVYNSMRGYLPYLLALSANSPFAEGSYTHLHSARTQLFTKFFPRCNIPAPFRNWQDYADYVETLFITNSINKITQIWWSVRPHPLFGTIEIRVCDCQSDITDTLAISALIVALVAQLANDYDEGKRLPVLSPNEIEENFWRAIRYGMDGKLVDFSRRLEVPAVEAIIDLIDYTSATHSPLGLSRYISRIEKIIEVGNGAQRQIRLYENSGDIASVQNEVVQWTQPHNWSITRQPSSEQ